MMFHNENTSGPMYTKIEQPVDKDLTLNEINVQEVRTLYPLIIFYAAILIIGVIGNALVLVVYTFRYKRSPARVYILFLAAIDFSMCLFGLPYHLIDLTHPYTFTNSLTCKSLTFVITTLFHASIFGLIVISIDRYLKICKPLSQMQIAYFGKRRACGGAALGCCLSSFSSWPNLILYGPSEMESPVANITGYACFIETKYLETSYPIMYIMITLCVCIASTIFLIIAYSLICHQIFSRYQNVMFVKTRKSLFEDTSPTEEVSLKSFSCHGQKHKISHIPFKSRSLEQLTSKDINDQKPYASNTDIELGVYHGNPNMCVTCNSNGSLTFMNAFAEDTNSNNSNGEPSKMVPRRQLHFKKHVACNNEEHVKGTLLELSDTDNNDEDNEDDEDDINEERTVIKPLNENKKIGTDLINVYSRKEPDGTSSSIYNDSLRNAFTKRRVSASGRLSDVDPKETVHTICRDNNSMCNLLNRSNSDFVEHANNNISDDTAQPPSLNVSNKTCNYDMCSSGTSYENMYRKKMQKRMECRHARADHKLNPPDGFPMCRPQTLKRRCSEQIQTVTDMSIRWQRSASLEPSPTHVINHVDMSTGDGLRIHNSCTSVLHCSQTTIKSKSNKPIIKKHSKITKIMLTITIVFILSYTPALVVTIWAIVQPDLWDVISIHETFWCEFFLRFYLVNNICNPFIYGFWDKHFLREIGYSFKKISDKCRCST